MQQNLRIAIAHRNADVRETVRDALTGFGHAIVFECESGNELLDHCRSDPPDLLITGVELAEREGISVLIELSEEQALPAIIVTPRTSLHLVERALEDHVMAYLVEPIDAEQLRPTIYLVLRRFQQFQELRDEVESVKQALADRKTIERAKGLLMKQDDLDEEEAYLQLRRSATDRRMKLIEVARRLIADDDASGDD